MTDASNFDVIARSGTAAIADYAGTDTVAVSSQPQDVRENVEDMIHLQVTNGTSSRRHQFMGYG